MGGILLARVAEDVDGPLGVVDDPWDVETQVLLSESVDAGDFVIGQLDLDKVLDDTRGSDGLGDHTVTAHLGPSQTKRFAVSTMTYNSWYRGLGLTQPEQESPPYRDASMRRQQRPSPPDG